MLFSHPVFFSLHQGLPRRPAAPQRREQLHPLEAMLLGLPTVEERPGPCCPGRYRPLPRYRLVPYTREQCDGRRGANPLEEAKPQATGSPTSPDKRQKPKTTVCENGPKSTCEKKAGKGQPMEEDGWHTSFSMAGYHPDDIDVTVEEGAVRVRAEREDRARGGLARRAVRRAVRLPRGLRRETVSVWLDGQGVMHVAAEGGLDKLQSDTDSPRPQVTGDIVDTDGTRPQDEDNKDGTESKVTAGTDATASQVNEKEKAPMDNTPAAAPTEKTNSASPDKEVEVIDISQEPQSPSEKPVEDTETPTERKTVTDESNKMDTDATEAETAAEKVGKEKTMDSSPSEEAVQKTTPEDNDTSEGTSTAEGTPAALEAPQTPGPLVKPFEVTVDVSGFDPDDLRVQLVSGRQVVVSAEHTEDQEGVVSHRQLTRTFTLPPNVDVSHVTSSLTSQGQLTVRAATRRELSGDREVDIQREA